MEEQLTLEEKIIEMIKTCYDPEIPVNIYELGLIYDINVEDDGAVDIKMTLTSPACPVAVPCGPESPSPTNPSSSPSGPKWRTRLSAHGEET